MYIESLQNPKIKNLLKLQEKSRERKNQGTFVIEGVQENELALKGGYQAIEIFCCEEIYTGDFSFGEAKQYTISRAIFEKLAYRKSTGGLIGVYQRKSTNLEELHLPENPLIIVLEAVEKPGNLGAVLRTADGAKADAVIVCDETVDFFNPNVIRSSVGTLFTNQIASAPKEDVLQWLKQNQLQVFATFLREDTVSLFDVDFSQPSAIILGTEATGLSDFWADNANRLIKIPMLGYVDSLNVSNAAAICTYEAVRQRIQRLK